MKLTMEEASRIIDAAKAASREASVASAIAVVDQGGHLLAFARSENALLATIEVAQVKARTAVYFGTDTKNLPFDKPFTPALLGAVSQPLAFVAGGVPVRGGGEIIGAIGVGGGSAEQDHQIAVAGVSAINL